MKVLTGKKSLVFAHSVVPHKRIVLTKGTAYYSHITEGKMGIVFNLTQFPGLELLNLSMRICQALASSLCGSGREEAGAGRC